MNADGSNGFDAWNRPTPQVQITSPSFQANFQLNQNNQTTSDPVSYSATSIDTTSAINWTTSLEYVTSGGKGAFETDDTFSTQPNATQTEQYTSMGGQLSAAAIQGTSSDSTTITITGVQIPAAVITARLDSLYHGATPNLMTGIAMTESSYSQFSNRTLFQTTALWPTESFDGGSHIGLMMVPVKADVAWNWLTNTSSAVALFTGQKLPTALRWESRIRQSATGLGPLSPPQVEDMALGLYGPGAAAGITHQVYASRCVGGTVAGRECKGGTWRWIRNMAGNPLAVRYVDKVRRNLQ